jgi:hypothetical protein
MLFQSNATMVVVFLFFIFLLLGFFCAAYFGCS